ncbi:hypothetical protein Bbelb_066730 [Branchiostoma belcheri]|nr:hypothetical protein Bbelb_066730 [Branchiostoma belcheri]
MASVTLHGREEQAGNNYAPEDAPCPLWCLWEAETVPDHVPVCAVLLSKFQLEDLLAILCTCPIPVCVPEGPVTYLQDKRTLDFDHTDPETGLQQEEEPDFVGRAA